MEKKEVMAKLKKNFKAWLVIVLPENEDNGETVDNYLIFTEDKVLKVYFWDGYQNENPWKEILSDVKEESSLEYWKTRLIGIAKQLDTERKERLLKLLEK